MARLPLHHRFVVLVVSVVILPSCGDDGDDSGRPSGSTTTVAAAASCDPVAVDPLDPGSTQHLLPGAPAPSYPTDPPTSGPHDAGDPVTGLQSTPLEKPLQVTVLEVGGIVVQFRPDLGEEDRRLLTALADEKVVVAPNPSLPAPVVATAWRRRLVCREFDVAAVQNFITDRKGKGPG
ncbi:MAG TPA: DUF3105 domain-containing protein [Acidimicrobiales bacterium]|nr:DUF3105 domain-containing protein [Acidimicrobiales bacterium]